jgi:sulfur-carrier protein
VPGADEEILSGRVGLYSASRICDVPTLKGPAVPVEVRLPNVLRTHADGQPSVSVDGATVAEVFTALVDQYPNLRGNLLDDTGGLHKFVNVYKEDDDIRYLEGLDTKLSDGDVLSILPAVAGGA